MGFVIIASLAIIVPIIIRIICRHTRFHKYDGEDICHFITATGAVVLALLLFLILASNVNPSVYKEANEMKAESLQLIIDNHKEDADRAYIEAVDYNTDLIRHQKLTQNFWFGWFIPDYVDDLKPINIE